MRSSADRGRVCRRHGCCDVIGSVDTDATQRFFTEGLRFKISDDIRGVGRHHIGSNFFWYLKDLAGGFFEYHSELDCILDDRLWEPSVFEEPRASTAGGRCPVVVPPSRGSRRPDDRVHAPRSGAR
ncbi:hypothetical protein ACH4S9_15310 [Streptomyces sp. NPDC021225]|uniref:hypothetical protein n=1 Tax=Streptomyces sp. NPDC021225 TaxID=3365121 RepID=UPI0037A2CD23